MPVWKPEETWKDQDVYIIGGGPSLRDFDWSLLHDEYTIGCNTAFTLGVQVCKICIFGDYAWWQVFHRELESYKGIVFASMNRPPDVPWVWTMKRKPQGLYTDALGWNGNTGAMAINLALLLGAKRVFLLGFDMKRKPQGMKVIEDCPNWHDRTIRPAATKHHIYQGFVRDFRFVLRDWKAKFADRQIINITKDSGLGSNVIPWQDPDAFWADRRAKKAPTPPDLRKMV